LPADPILAGPKLPQQNWEAEVEVEVEVLGADVGPEAGVAFVPPPPLEQAVANKAASKSISDRRVRDCCILIWIFPFKKTPALLVQICPNYRPMGGANALTGRLTMVTRGLLILGGMLKFAENFLK
jgi:hypothetical protein